MEAGLDKNFRQLGRLLASLNLQLYQAADGGGLIQVDGGKVRRIATAKDLAPMLIDSVRIHVIKKGNYHGERIGEASLGNMLHAKSFLGNFKVIEDVVTTPVVLSDMTPSQPGFNDGGILYLGTPVSTCDNLDTTNKFLDVMDWASNADRTNAVAASLTILFRHHWLGGKPLVLVTATKSHSGKGTVIEFVRGLTSQAQLLYENLDWPMEKALQAQLLRHPEIGVINLDNVRLDSSGGRARIIRSGFLESFVTNGEVMLNSPGLRPVRTANKFVLLLNTNEGSLSIDLLNRALPIRLAPTGDVTQRKSPIGNPKLEFLPANRSQIEAERWGMIQRWVEAGKPLDESVAHYPMSVWAKTIGGILQVNGFKDFLGNFSATRAAADPIREAISILAFHSAGKPLRAGTLATKAVGQGLAKTLLVGADPANTAACERLMGVVLKPYVGETFTAVTSSEKITYRLKKESKRWDTGSPHYRYTFEEIGREALAEEPHGLVLEERAAIPEPEYEPDGLSEISLDTLPDTKGGPQ